MSRALTLVLAFMWLVCRIAGSQDLSGSVWIFSLGAPPQPLPDNTWKIVKGVAGSPVSVLIQRGKTEAAEFPGSFDGKELVVRVSENQMRGTYRATLSSDGNSLEGSYSEVGSGKEIKQPIRLTRLDSLAGVEALQLSWLPSSEDPDTIVCRALVPSGRRLHFSWSFDGELQPALSAEVRLTRVSPGEHTVRAIGFDGESAFLTAPQTLTFTKSGARSWDLPLLAVALGFLGLALVGWGRKQWIKSVEVDLGGAPKSSGSWLKKSARAEEDSILPVRGDGVDETLLQIRGILAEDVELRAPDPSPRLLFKKVEAGVMVRAVYLGSRTAPARLEMRRGAEVSTLKVSVEPILIELQLDWQKPGFEPKTQVARVGGLCGGVMGRLTSKGQPVAFARGQACLRVDGGEWSDPVAAQTDGEGFFSLGMPARLVEVLGVELPEFRLEKLEISLQAGESLDDRCAEQPHGAGGAKGKASLKLHPEAEEWLNMLAEWVGKGP